MSETKPKSKTVKPDGAQKPAGDAAVLVPVPSGEPPAEDAELVAVRTKTAPRFYRCGLEFVRSQSRMVRRSELSEANWQRLLAEPNLLVQGVVMMAADDAYDEDVPQ